MIKSEINTRFIWSCGIISKAFELTIFKGNMFGVRIAVRSLNCKIHIGKIIAFNKNFIRQILLIWTMGGHIIKWSFCVCPDIYCKSFQRTCLSQFLKNNPRFWTCVIFIWDYKNIAVCFLNKVRIVFIIQGTG